MNKNNRLYRLNDAQQNSCVIDYRIKDILSSIFPEIDNACLALLMNHPTLVTMNNHSGYVASCSRMMFIRHI